MVGFHFINLFGPDVFVFRLFGLAVFEGLEDDFLKIFEVGLVGFLFVLVESLRLFAETEVEVEVVLHDR